jgi:hypothetical protein
MRNRLPDIRKNINIFSFTSKECNHSSTCADLHTTLWLPTSHLLIRLQMLAVFHGLSEARQQAMMSENWATDTSSVLLMISEHHGIVASAALSYSWCPVFCSRPGDWLCWNIRGLPQYLQTDGVSVPKKSTTLSFQSFPTQVKKRR